MFRHTRSHKVVLRVVSLALTLLLPLLLSLSLSLSLYLSHSHHHCTSPVCEVSHRPVREVSCEAPSVVNESQGFGVIGSSFIPVASAVVDPPPTLNTILRPGLIPALSIGPSTAKFTVCYLRSAAFLQNCCALSLSLSLSLPLSPAGKAAQSSVS